MFVLVKYGIIILYKKAVKARKDGGFMKRKIFAVWMIITGVVLGMFCGSRGAGAIYIPADMCLGDVAHPDDRFIEGFIEDKLVTAAYSFDNSDSFEFLGLLNAERIKAGLNPVQMDVDLLCDAQQRAAETGLVLWSHARPAGQNATPLKKGGAENIGRYSPDGKSAFEGWRASSGHYDNMMNPDIEVIGVAHYGTWWVWLGSYAGLDGDKIISEKDVPAVQCREITIELGDYQHGFYIMRTKDIDNYAAFEPSDMRDKNFVYYEPFSVWVDNGYNEIVPVNSKIPFATMRYNEVYGSQSMYTWASSNTKVAKVDGNGLVTTLSKGTTVISCKPKYGGTAATYRLTVGNAAGGGKTDVSVPKVKKNIKVKVQNASYKVTNTKKQTVTLMKAPKTKKVVVPASITINGKAYKVTTVGKKAFAGNTRLTQVTIGKNIKKIETKAFYGCKKLKKVVYKGKKSKISKGSKAFGKCNKLKKKYK